MNTPARTFSASPAVRAAVPLWIGLTGPSGGGKTYTALEVATGIQSVRGGEIFYIDTEANRALHYADYFNFKHVPFGEPFGALDYLAAIKFCASQGASVIVIDSMSHEHEGAGGLLEAHEAEVDRMAGDDWKKREAVKMLAWNKPKAARRRLIQSMLQMNTCFILCFRAKDTSKPVKNPQTGKNEVVHMGFTPIAGDEFVFEMTVNALLLPGANGVPTWKSDLAGESMRIKRPRQFIELFGDGVQITRKHGVELAKWAAGVATEPKKASAPAGSLTDRAAALEAALKAAKTKADVTATWEKAVKLRGALAESDRSTLEALELLRDARTEELP